jgi:hypothetical protein
MAAAWPYCDAVVSAHTLHALDDLAAALAHPGRREPLPADRLRSAPAKRLPANPRTSPAEPSVPPTS